MRRIPMAIGISVLAGVLTSARPVHADAPDAWITMKTKLALLTTDGVQATDVGVDTTNGRVTLHGTVESNAEKMKAEEVARKLDGVRDVRNLLQVVPESREKAVAESDERIKGAVERALQEDPWLEESRIAVTSVNKGVVLLNGTADSMSAHLAAVAAARSVPGVTRVASEVTSPDRVADSEIWRDDLREAKGDVTKAAEDSGRSVKRVAKDMWITSDIKARLLAADDVPALDVNVDTRRGVVSLFGVVSSQAAKAAAEAHARKVDGVKSVQNGIQVVPKSSQESVSDKDDVIEERVEKMLKGNETYHDVDVEVKNGVARITGKVPSRSESMRVAIHVRGVSGVRSVQNDLRLGG